MQEAWLYCDAPCSNLDGRAFLIKYRDRVVYGTDNVPPPSDKTGDVL